MLSSSSTVRTISDPHRISFTSCLLTALGGAKIALSPLHARFAHVNNQRLQVVLAQGLSFPLAITAKTSLSRDEYCLIYHLSRELEAILTQKFLEGQCYRSSVVKPETFGLSPESLEGQCLVWTDVTERAAGRHRPGVTGLAPLPQPSLSQHAAGLQLRASCLRGVSLGLVSV